MFKSKQTYELMSMLKATELSIERYARQAKGEKEVYIHPQVSSLESCIQLKRDIEAELSKRG